jgi:hypothetical protein
MQEESIGEILKVRCNENELPLKLLLIRETNILLNSWDIND